jgi:hypothetical protein
LRPGYAALLAPRGGEHKLRWAPLNAAPLRVYP